MSTSSADPSDMFDLDSTFGLPDPATDQPPAPDATDASRTGSSNTTRMLDGDSAVAPIMLGIWPSDRVRFAVPAPNGLPSSSTTAAPLTSIQPVALGAAVALPKASSCVREPFQSAGCVCGMVRASPPTCSAW